MNTTLKTIYVMYLLQRLAYTSSTLTLSDNIYVLQALTGVLSAIDKTKKQEWEGVLAELADLELRVTKLEEEIAAFKEDVAKGWLGDVPETLAKEYAAVVIAVRKIEGKIIERLSEVLGKDIPVELWLGKR